MVRDKDAYLVDFEPVKELLHILLADPELRAVAIECDVLKPVLCQLLHHTLVLLLLR